MAYAPQLDEAIQLVDSQDKAGAQRVLARYLQSTPRDEYAWLWLAYILPNRLQQQQALQQCLKFFPNSQKAQHNLDSLRLGLPLERPNLPPDTPPHAYSSFFGRDLYLPGSEADADDLAAILDEPEAVPEAEATFQPAFLDETEPRLVYPSPAKDPSPASDWIHEAALEAPAGSEPATKAGSRSSTPPATAYRRPTSTRRQSKRLAPLQWLILGVLFFLTLAIICVGSYYIFSNPPYSNVLTCFQAALNNEFPCPECPAAVQVFPECPPQPTSAPLPPPIIPTPTITPTLLPPTAQPTLEPTATLAPVQPTGTRISLPAPLLFLSEVAGNTQIWKLASDVSSLAPITTEINPVTAFDISPVNGEIAYISDNSLIVVDADGSNRRTLVAGTELPGIDDPSYWSVVLSNPLWSPDGTQIAYAQDGIQVLSLRSNTTRRLQANSYSPSQPDQAQIFAPLAWSPDGTRLAVRVSQGACASLSFISASGGQTSTPTLLPFGQPVWDLAGTSVLVANPTADCACSNNAGLYRVDPAAATSTALLGGLEKTQAAYVGFPKAMPDGSLLYFYGELPADACSPGLPSQTLLNLVVGVGEAWDLRMVLRPDSYLIDEALWAHDGSLVVIMEHDAQSQSRDGALRLLYSDGRPVVDLPVSGRSLHWSIPAP